MIHHLIRAAILIGFAMFIVFLFRTGDIVLYIAPRMELLMKLSALGLYAAGIYQVYAALRHSRIKESDAVACDCGHPYSHDGHHHSYENDHAHGFPRSILRSAVIYGLFLLPLLLGFLVPTGTLGSALAAKKGMSFAGSESVSRKENNSTTADSASSQHDPAEAGGMPFSADGVSPADSLDDLFPADEYTADHAEYGKRLYAEPLIRVPEAQFIETLTTLDLYREAFMGKEVEISGFVYREKDMGQDRIAVSRFAMNCCSADALPYGLMILWPKAGEYAADEWIAVRGRLTLSGYMDNEIIALNASRVERIDAPDSPYVYPDLEFGM